MCSCVLLHVNMCLSWPPPSLSVTRMSLAAVEGLEAVVGCEQGRWPEFIQVQKMVRMEAKMNEQKPKSIIQNNFQ